MVVEDVSFAALLRTRLMQAIRQEGREVSADEYRNRPLRQRVMEYVALALMRLALAIQGKKYL